MISSIHRCERSFAFMVTCERWLCAPYAEIFFEHGHRLVTGTTTRTHISVCAVAALADEGRLVVHQALDAGHRAPSS